jgi:hypothetical protein
MLKEYCYLTIWEVRQTFLEKLILTHSVKKIPAFLDFKISLPWWQNPVTGSYPESVESSSYLFFSLRYILISFCRLRIYFPNSFFRFGFLLNFFAWAGFLTQCSVWLRTGRPGDRSSIPAKTKEFFLYSLCPDWLWGPPSPMGTGVLSSGVKRGRGVILTTHFHLVPRSWMSRSYTSSPPKRLHGV